MSWGQFPFGSADDYEESFWPSFTDIMMVIVMVFLLVTVAVVVTNTRLLDELRSSLVAEQEASKLAEFRMKENATLEEQLEFYQQRMASLEMELLRSRALSEDTREQLEQTQTALRRLQLQDQTQIARLQQRDETIAELRETLLARGDKEKDLERDLAQARTQLSAAQGEVERVQAAMTERADRLATLRSEQETQVAKFSRLQGEFDELDKKYQKLLKPTRSSKGKTTVDVIYQRSGYRMRKPGAADYRDVSKVTLERTLSVLKEEHGTDLYVKIIIPENSGLSYNEAWRFTSEMLNKYDYYYQEDEAPAEEVPSDDAAAADTDGENSTDAPEAGDTVSDDLMRLSSLLFPQSVLCLLY